VRFAFAYWGITKAWYHERGSPHWGLYGGRRDCLNEVDPAGLFIAFASPAHQLWAGSLILLGATGGFARLFLDDGGPH